MTHKRTISEEWPLLIKILGQYYYVMNKEAQLSLTYWPYPQIEEIYGVARQIMDIAMLNLVPRSYNGRYNEFKGKYALESVGGHTNLVIAIINRFLRYEYWGNFQHTEKDQYDLMEITEAIQRHDQPELESGDWPDNGDRDETEKLRQEALYHKNFSQFSPERDEALEYRVSRLLNEMNHQSSPTGRFIYVADKISADIITLAYDKVGLPLVMAPDSPHASERDRREMALCDYRLDDGSCYASEMWAVDYFKERNLVRFDEDGYLTALLVMCTLLVNNGEWYTWREADYH